MLYQIKACDDLAAFINASGISGIHSTEAVWVPSRTIKELENRICTVFPVDSRESRYELSTFRAEIQIVVAVQQVAKSRAAQDEVAQAAASVRSLFVNSEPIAGFSLDVGQNRVEANHLKEFGVMTVYFEATLVGFLGNGP